MDQIGYGAYNLHPGPLQFPGWAPYSFALYEGVTRFGITLHEMTAEIDNGPIIWSTNFDISEDTVQSELSNIAADECFQFLESVAIQLCQPELLKRMNVAWMGKKNTQQDFKKMCDISESISLKEFNQRLKAFGLGDGKYRLFTQQGEFKYEFNILDDPDKIEQYVIIHGVKFGLVK